MVEENRMARQLQKICWGKVYRIKVFRAKFGRYIICTLTLPALRLCLDMKQFLSQIMFFTSDIWPSVTLVDSL